MIKDSIYCAGSTRASRYAATYLKELHLPVVDHLTDTIQHLLLDVPSLGPEGQLRGGGSVEDLLNRISKDTVIYGGNLTDPVFENYKTIDFLHDPAYLAENAYITSECALDVALPYLNITLRRCPTLIIGWGRIGKCLAQLLKNMDADVTVAARKESDRAMIHAMGYQATDTYCLEDPLPHYRLIFNTVPSPVLNESHAGLYHPDCVKIELASKNGIIGDDVIIARGLPGIHTPESSGKLIAHTFLKYYQKEETP